MKEIVRQREYTDIVLLIKQSRLDALKSVNTELINLYWNVGHYISKRIKSAEWGDKTIDELANFIQKTEPNLKGFNWRGLYRMRQFYETYSQTQIVSAVLTQFDRNAIKDTILAKISWTNHLTILSRCKMEEEREF